MIGSTHPFVSIISLLQSARHLLPPILPFCHRDLQSLCLLLQAGNLLIAHAKREDHESNSIRMPITKEKLTRPRLSFNSIYVGWWSATKDERFDSRTSFNKEFDYVIISIDGRIVHGRLSYYLGFWIDWYTCKYMH